jgi:hypothetical protein
MGSPEEEGPEPLKGKDNSFQTPLKIGLAGPAGGESKGKASPEQVIGKRRPMGRLNKRLILGVIGALGMGMLILNFLPSGKSKKFAESQNSVYANDTMPQDIQEMALSVPPPTPASGSSVDTSGYQGATKAGSPFAGYQGATGDGTTPSRTTSPDSADMAARDYQGMAATDAKLEAEAAARRAPMEVATSRAHSWRLRTE